MKKGIEFLEREAFFSEKTLQTRAANGDTHRIPRNAERIEHGCRQVPGRFGCLGPRFHLACRAKMTVVWTQTPSIRYFSRNSIDNHFKIHCKWSVNPYKSLPKAAQNTYSITISSKNTEICAPPRKTNTFGPIWPQVSRNPKKNEPEPARGQNQHKKHFPSRRVAKNGKSASHRGKTTHSDDEKTVQNSMKTHGGPFLQHPSRKITSRETHCGKKAFSFEHLVKNLPL